MKKIIFIFSLVVLFLATSCTSTKDILSDSAYQDAKHQVQANMEQNGYKPSGEHHDEKNEVTVTGQSYSKYTGYGTKMDNNYYQCDTYKFTNQDGESAEYSVKYKILEADGGGYGLSEVQVLGCSTTKAADYTSICSGKASPRSIIDNAPRDATNTTMDVAATTAAASCIALLATLAVYLIIL